MKNMSRFMARHSVLCLVFLFSHLCAIYSLSFNNSSSSVKHFCSPEESLALLDFKNSIIASNSTGFVSFCGAYRHPKMLSWKEDTDCCSWDGVTCDRLTGHVTNLDLSLSGLAGTIHENSRLFLLHNLQKLNLACNDFEETNLLSQFGGFSKLTYLNLSSSSFRGSVPPEISHLSKLFSLDLSRNYELKMNQLTFNDLLKNATELRHLVLDTVDMSSVLPGSLANLSTSLVSLSVKYCELQGKFPVEVFRFPRLEQLLLSSNWNLTIDLPKYNWSGPLRMLDLSFTDFSGKIPDVLGDLRYLNELDLSKNNATGPVPASIANLNHLTRLDLSENNFLGQFPDVFNNLSEMKEIQISRNHFSGQFPLSLFNLTEVSLLDVSDNEFWSHLPSQISGLQYLTSLNLSYNNLTGELPPWLFSLFSLEELDLGHNKLTASVKQLQQNNTLLKFVDLSNNEISSLFSSTNTANINFTLPNLECFLCSSCGITEFPWFLRASKDLYYLALSDNRISGEVFLTATESWQSLVALDLSQNFLKKFAINSSMLDQLYLHSNMLQGPLMVPPPSVHCYSVSENELNGEIPLSFCNLSSTMFDLGLSYLDLSDNNFSGTIPECLGNYNHLDVLDLGMNNFTGDIPLSFKNDSWLTTLNLNDNHLEGRLPASLVNCSNLEVLDVGNNMITDTFPDWLATLPKLQVLVLRSNRFHGSIGSFQANVSFPKLRILDLSRNKFTGLLPTKLFESFNAMMRGNHKTVKSEYMTHEIAVRNYQYSVFLTMKGIDIQLERVLTIFTTIDLSSNQFHGPISESVGNLNSLKVLNFSHNDLAGFMPSSLRNLTALESLDLSSNNLVGKIPLQLASLTSLAWLNLSYNQLVGPIPQGQQFNTFDTNSYIGNLGLCGFPMTEKCGNGDRLGSTPPTFDEEKDYTWEWFWRIVMMGYGSGFVVGVSMTYIAFSTGGPFWIIKLYERMRQPWRKVKRPRERHIVG